MAYRIAVLDDDIRELDRTVERLSIYGESYPQNELQITCFQEMKLFMEAVCSGNGKEELWKMIDSAAGTNKRFYNREVLLWMNNVHG